MRVCVVCVYVCVCVCDSLSFCVSVCVYVSLCVWCVYYVQYPFTYHVLLYHTDEPPCQGECLPTRTPVYFERLFLSEIDESITEGRIRNIVPTHINVYRDDTDILFSVVFSGVDNATACTILTSATINTVSETKKRLKKTHQVVSVACYLNHRNRPRCIAVFCPTRQMCGQGAGGIAQVELLLFSAIQIIPKCTD